MLEKIKNLPDFYGDSLKSVGAWESCRASVLDKILDTEYGVFPKLNKPSTTAEVVGINFASKAEWTRVSFNFEDKGKHHTVEAELILPTKKTDYGVLLYIDFSKETPSKYLPVEEIIDGGFGIFKVYYEDITTDNGDFENGLCGLVDGAGTDFGKIAVWSYMLRVMVDYLTENSITKNIAVVGHSRLGKTALLTAAIDTRIMLGCINDSGCCGASLSRFKDEGEEKISDIVRVFPYWFKNSFKQYVNNEERLPFDQHMLISLVAPRNLVIGCARQDHWADNDGAFNSLMLANPVWKLYSKNGFVHSGYECKALDYLDGELGYYIREGSHFLSREDWQKYMLKFKELLNGNKE